MVSSNIAYRRIWHSLTWSGKKMAVVYIIIIHVRKTYQKKGGPTIASGQTGCFTSD